MLEFSISNQTLTRLDAAGVVSDSQNYLTCSFQFSQDWDGVTAVATFGHSQVAQPITVPIVDGVCQVPHEVIHPYGFYLAVYGVGERGSGVFAHIPTDTVTVEVEESGQAVGLAAPAPTPSLYDSLMAAINAGVESAAASKTSAESSAQTALSAAEGAAAARDEAQSAAQAAESSALDALQDAQAAQRSLVAAQELIASLEADGGAMARLRGEMEDAIILQKSYTVGTDSYRLVGSYIPVTWVNGTAERGYLGLEPARRYLVDLNGVRYEGVSHLAPDPGPGSGGSGGQTGPGGMWDDDERPEVPPGIEEDDGTEVELPGEVETGRRVVELEVGPVHLADTWNGESDRKCVLTTTDTSVQTIAIYTDGRDNGKYYMEEARAARDEAVNIVTYLRTLMG